MKSSAPETIAPRPYQEAAIAAVIDARQRGRQRVLLTMPTGTGKTNVFVWLMERLNLQRPALVLAHRDELIRQAAERIAALAPGVRIGIEKAAETAPASSEVVVASVQSIGRRDCGRLEWLAQVGPELVICDEAHHAPAESYIRTFARFGAFTPGGAFLVGCTATPHRIDARSMGQVFEEEVYRYELRDAMKAGWLAPIRCYRVVTKTDISTVRTAQGDFEVGALAAAVNHQARTEQVIAHWREVAAGRRTLVFCVNVAHAHDAAALFRAAGIPAEAIDGGTPDEERRAILARLRSGETPVVTNCAVLTEGFDCPEVSCVVMLRPTQSSALYTQMAGRGTRIAPEKRDLVLIDVVDNCTRHSLVTAPVLLGLPSTLDLQGSSMLKTAELVDQLGAGAAVLDIGRPVTVRELQTKLQQWDIFAQIELPAEIRGATGLAWAPVPYGFYLSCGANRDARIHRDMVGDFRLHLFEEGEEIGGKALGRDVCRALRTADAEVMRCWPEAGNLIRMDLRWRSEPATEKQLRVLSRKGVPAHTLQRLTKGEAQRAIAKLMAR